MVENVIYLVLLLSTGYFNLAKTADDIKKLTKYSFFFIAYIVIVLVVQTPYYKKEVKPEYQAFHFSFKDWVKSYGCFIYSFNCIVNVFLVKTTLKSSSKPRLKKIFNRAVLFLTIFYLFVGFSGYISFGKKVSEFELVLQRPPLKDSNDIFMKIGLCFVSFLTFIGYITHVIPIK